MGVSWSDFITVFENLRFKQKENEGRKVSLKRDPGVGRLKKLSARRKVVFTKEDNLVWVLKTFIVWGALKGSCVSHSCRQMSWVLHCSESAWQCKMLKPSVAETCLLMGTLTVAGWRGLNRAYVKVFTKATKAGALLAGFPRVCPQRQRGSWQRTHSNVKDLPCISTWMPNVLSCAMVFWRCYEVWLLSGCRRKLSSHSSLWSSLLCQVIKVVEGFVRIFSCPFLLFIVCFTVFAVLPTEWAHHWSELLLLVERFNCNGGSS